MSELNSLLKENFLQLRCFKVEIGSVVSVDIFSRVEETHVCLQRKSSMLEAAASSTLFPCEY
jgi:hypothetical protein